MGHSEDFRFLHTNGRKMVDVKKTAIIDLFCCNLPESQSIDLFGNQSIQAIKTLWIFYGTVSCDSRSAGNRGQRTVASGIREKLF